MRMADRYEEVEAENGKLHMQVRKLKAEVEELVDAWTRDIEQLEREVRLMRQQYDRRVEERDDLLAALEQTLAMIDAVCDKQGFDKHKQHSSKAARAAIARAKGGE
jgi:uncharacterized protein YukE